LPDQGFDGKSMILKRLFKSQEKPERALYAAIVAAARHPRFYQNMGVADTLDGRFEMIVLHLFLALNRLKAEGVEELRQNLTDEFFNDMDGSLRELGVSDVTVGKKVRKLAESYYGRVLAYDRARVQPQLLEETVNRNIYPGGASPDCAIAMVQYIKAATQTLSALPLENILRGELKFQ
jgi:cytochrome b pre-mRNA-processing protein 3